MANTKITTAVIKDDAITTAKIADDAVTGALIADDVALAGNPTTTTQSAGNNTTRIATTAFVTTAINNLVDSAPSALDTLNELAAAMGDDANFSTTVTNSIATKAALAGAAFTGDVSVTGSSSGSTVLTLTSNALADTPLMVFQRTGGAVAGKLAYEDGNTAISFGTTSAHELKLLTNNTSQVEITSGGDVGIGATPAFGSGSGLEVSRSGTATVRVERTGSTASSGEFFAGNGKVVLSSISNNHLEFRTNNTEAMRIDSSGRLLLGSDAAVSVTGGARQFQIEGTSGVTSSMSIIRNTNNASGSVISMSKSRSGSDGGVTIVADNDVLGEIRFGGADGIDHDSIAAVIGAEVDGTPGANDMPGALVFSTTADGAASATERMRIDSSGNLLVSLTSTSGIATGSTANNGAYIDYSVGAVVSQSSANKNFYAAKASGYSDPDFISFQVDGSAVGSIGTVSSDIYIGTGDTTIRFADGSDAILATGTNSATRDGAIDLGHPSHRFKDLYLSGNVKVANGQGIDFSATANSTGTMSSELLDDYEEGTFTATLSASNTAPTITGNNNFTCQYEKVGAIVHCRGYTGTKSITNVGVGIAKITGLPFTNSGSYYGVVNFTHNTMFPTTMDGYLEAGSTFFYPIQEHTTSGVNYQTGTQYLMFSVTYRAA